MEARSWTQAQKVVEQARALSAADRADFVPRSCVGHAGIEPLVWSLLELEADRGADSASAVSPAPFERDSLIADHYRILRPVGRGGMGIVYAAQDVRLQRLVALKFLPPEWSSNPAARRRLVAEARAASALDHASICSIFEVTETEDGRLFIAMAYYEGETLASRIGSGRLSVPEAIDMAVEIAVGLERAHEAGILHRDVKPTNIMLTERGEVKILDFGLAELVSHARRGGSGQIVGTLPYMAPEQLRGGRVDQRSDTWSLGVTLYQMLTGRLPFVGDCQIAVMRSILEDDPAPLGDDASAIPEPLQGILDKVLAKNPDSRHLGAGQLGQELRRVRESDRLQWSSGPGPGLESRRAVLWGLGTALLIALAFLFWAKSGQSGPAQDVRPIESLAVLPLIDESGEAMKAYLVNGITEQLTRSLGRLGSVSVISPTAVASYRGTERSLPEIAGELDIDAVVEGVLVRGGDEIELTVRLVRAESGELVWDESYRGDLGRIDVFLASIGDEIAGRLDPSQSRPIDRSREPRPVGSAAQDLYYRGRYALDHPYLGGVLVAARLLEEAIAQDPSHALAHSDLAELYLVLPELGRLPRAEAFSRARRHAEMAIDLDPALPEPHAALMRVSTQWDLDWDSAEREVLRALELNPSLVLAHRRYAQLLSSHGRHQEALARLRRVRELDPSSQASVLHRLPILYLARRYDDAIQEAQVLLASNPELELARRVIGRCYLQKGQIPEALEALEHRGAGGSSDLAYAYALAGWPERAEEELAVLLEQNPLQPYVIATVLIGLGRFDEALDYLEEAHRDRSPMSVMLMVDPQLDSVRDEPRFQALLELMAFPPAR